MHAWQIPYLGWQKLPAELCAFEVEHSAALQAEERRAGRSRCKSVLRLGAGSQTGLPRMRGRPLDAVQRVPAALRTVSVSKWLADVPGSGVRG